MRACLCISSHIDRELNWSRVPPNVKFEVDDCEEPWTFQQPFDFIHSRYMAAAIKDWPKLARQCFEHTTPGGYCEFQDFDLQYYSEDGSMTPEAPITDWVNTLLKASRDFGNDPHPGSKLGGWLEDAGFVDVRAEKFLVPIGPWAKDKHLVSHGSYFFWVHQDRQAHYVICISPNQAKAIGTY